MKELKVDFTPRFSRRLQFYSKRGISGSFTATGGTVGMYAGEKRQMYYKGKGLIFDGYREYTPLDDARMIDWRASLRANKKLVRKFSEEKNKNILFFLDVSSSMGYSSHTKLKNEYAAELIASLSYSFLSTGDSVGLVMFTDHLVLRRGFSVGQPQWLNLCKDLRNPKNYDGPFDFTRSLTELLGFLKQESVIFVVTDFIGLENDDWKKAFEIVSAKFELLIIMVRDPFDNYLPRGMGNVILENPFSNERGLADLGSIRTEYNEYNAKFISSIKSFVEKLGGDFIMLTTDKGFQKPVMNFLVWREETWR